MTVTVLPAGSILPQPIDARWRPLRAGLGDIWHYDDQVFEFYRGNLILRGANESGKTKALELLLPFLLDASTDARRLDPFGHGDRRMRWNLLGGTEAEPEQEQRNSWLWLEFGRFDDGGEPVCLTIGARLRATRGAKSELIHYFVTDQRVGDELELWESDEAGGRHALSADALIERIGQHGEVFDTRIGGRRERYRNVVDERLFGLGPERYEALITLLLAVRRPQLSQRLEPEALREFLDTALPPLDSVIVGEQADSLEGLRQREEVLDETRAAARAVGEFLGVYRDYATGQLSLGSAELRTAQSAYEAGREKLTLAAHSVETASIAETAAKDRLREIAADAARVSGQIGALERSEAFRNAQALEQAGQAADEARGLAVSATSREAVATAAHQAKAERRDRLVDRRTRNRQALGAKLRTATTKAAGASLVDEHRALEGLLADDDPEIAQLALSEAMQLEQARSVIVDDLRRRRRQIDPLERAETLDADALRRASSEREAAAAEAMTAEAATGAAIRELVERVIAWTESLREIDVGPGAFDDVEERLAAGDPLRPVLEAVAEPATIGQAAARARAELERGGLVGRRDQIEAELETVRASASIGPEASPTRPAARAGRQGAPFYALVDFAPGLTASDQAGLEAALEGAGILDAWMMPDGSLLGPDVLDAALDGASPRAGTGATLRSALRPVEGLAVPVELVARALDAIGLGKDRHASVAVGLEGSYRVGPLVGRFEKADAEFIGAGARELTRERAIARLEAQVKEIDDSISGVDANLGEVVRREERLARERAAAPVDQILVNARAAERSAQNRFELATGLEAEAATRHATAAAALGPARDDLRAKAATSGLSDQLDQLEELHEGVTTYRGSLAELASRLVLLAQDAADLAEAESEVAAAQKALDGAMAEAGEASRQLETRQSTYDTLKRTVGSSVSQILAELEAARGSRDKLKDDDLSAQHAKEGALRAVAAAETRLEDERELQAGRERERNLAADRFRTLAAVPDLLGLVITGPPDGPASEWSVTQTVDVARAVFRATGSRDVDRTEINAATNEVYTRYRTLQTQVGDDYRLEQQNDDGVFVPVVHRAGQPQTIVSLGAGLDHDVVQMTADLSKREREVFEAFLLGQVGRHLGERIREAHDLVDAMNDVLAQVKLPDGDRVRLHWAVDPMSAPGVVEAVGLLRRDPTLLDEGHWESIIEFFRSQVETAREKDSDGTWAERLAQGIDYRHWHRFEIEEVDSAGHRRLLTKKSHGTGSGGEKSVKLHLPLLAALAAHYRSAALFAPQLLLLDEAFAGIDDVVRGRLYGLLDQFDFSFFATAFGEWGMYAELSGTAVYHLVHRAELQAVHAEHFIWTGSEFLHASELAGVGVS